MKCQRCGRENAPGLTRCAYCNTPFFGPNSNVNMPERKNAAQNKAQRKPKTASGNGGNRGIIISIISLSVVFCILVGIVAIPAIFNNKPRRSGGGGGGGMSRASGYSLSFAPVQNGSVDISVAGYYDEGDTITLSATPSENYVFEKWESDNGGEFADVKSATTAFTMPAGNVVITAGFSEGEVVPEEIAALFGVNPDDYDTDGDGLSNYVEIYKTGTNPKLMDSDGNGISDADEDEDADELTNIEEIELGTKLTKKDTDDDGLNDNEEVNTHKTDPCNYDSDGDTLGDGDEIVLGLNPLAQKSDGKTIDSERKFTQKLSEKNVSEDLISDDNVAIPMLTLTASGNINNNVFVSATSSNDFSESRAIVGEAIDISGENISEGTISFALQNEGASIVEVDDDKTFVANLICKYNDDGSIKWLDTEYDVNTKTLSSDIDSQGTYFVMDVKKLFGELGLVMPSDTDFSSYAKHKTDTSMSTDVLDEYTGVEASSKTEKAKEVSAAKAMAQADIIFIVDTTSSMRDEINHVKNNINSFVDALKDKGVSAGLALVDYQDLEADGYDSTRVHKNGSSNWFYDMNDYKTAISSLELGHGGDSPECVIDALETARLLDMRASAGKIFVLVTDAGYKVDNRYKIPSMEEEITLLKNAGVTCSVISSSYVKSEYSKLYTETDGIWADIYGDFNAELTALADKIGEEVVGDGYWIYLCGPIPVPVRLDAMPEPGSSVDTDKDGIPDVKELESATPTGEINLDELLTRVSRGVITDTDYGVVKMYKYKSNPIVTDTDYDGISDDKDLKPKNNRFSGSTTRLKNNSVHASGKIKFTVDYRNFFEDNRVYDKDISVLSSIFAADIYEGKNGVYIEVNDGAILSGNNSPNSLFMLFGMNEVSSLPIGKDNDKTDIVIGNRTVEYNGTRKNIVLISIRGTNGTFEEWSSNFDVGADSDDYYKLTGKHDEWIKKENHKGFDVTANRVKKAVDDYISKNIDSEIPTVLWITGHSRGAGIANILGAMYEDEAKMSTYTYTFACPNTTVDSNASSHRYNSIFNIVNTDDLITALPLAEWEFKKYGITKSISVEESGYEDKKAWSNKVGTFEYLLDMDYNNNNKVLKTLEKFKKIANSREELYVFTYKEDTLQLHDINHSEREKAEADVKELESNLNETLKKYCQFKVVTGENILGKTVYRAGNYQTPAYFMQILALIASNAADKGAGAAIGTIVKNSVAAKYEEARNAFAKIGNDFTGGMNHPHWTETYYLIASNNFVSLR